MGLRIDKLVPAIGWIRGYRRADLSGDVQAGLTTAVMLIPQAMAYAMIAGLPPQVGLYASTVPLIVYALFGTSRQLAVGPVAMVSLLVAAGLTPIVDPQADLATYVTLALALMLVVGVIQLLMGALRLGFLVNFLSHPVTLGFTWAAALIIGLSQLKHVLGINLARSHHVHEIILEAGQHIGETNLITLAIGLGSVGIILALRRWNKAFPSALTVVVLGILAVQLGGLTTPVVGQIPTGMSWQGVPDVLASGGTWAALLPTALIISLVGFMESIAVAKSFATKNRYRVDANRELVGLGMANLAGGAFGGYPVTGGFSRTAVNAQAGARTPLASIITGVVIIITLFTITDLLYHLPKAVLAAIIMVAVFGLINVKEGIRVFKVKPQDGWLLVLTFVATLTLGIEQGIAVGVGASLLGFIIRTTRPHMAILGRLPGTEVYRNIVRNPDAERVPHTAIVRIDSSFWFANVNFLHERLRDLDENCADGLRTVIIDATSINHLDSSAADALLEIARDLRERHVELHIAGVRGPVREVMARVGLCDFLGADHRHHRVHDAVLATQATTSDDGDGDHNRDAAASSRDAGAAEPVTSTPTPAGEPVHNR